MRYLIAANLKQWMLICYGRASAEQECSEPSQKCI
jgi:hypothetical protein